MTRPVEPAVEVAARIAGGDLDIEIPDLGRNEYGDVARRINTFTADLRAQKQALDDEARRVDEAAQVGVAGSSRRTDAQQ